MNAEAAARWMFDRLSEDGFLYQETAAMHFAELDDDTLSYYDSQGNLCLGKSILAAFNKITPDHVYERSGKFWRERLSTDQPGRQQ